MIHLTPDSSNLETFLETFCDFSTSPGRNLACRKERYHVEAILTLKSSILKRGFNQNWEMGIDFYRKMLPVGSFSLIAKQESYSLVPEDWWIVITDVVNSTDAIENGRYKDVNTAGAISMVALSNQQILGFLPIIFGGDGITLLTPPEFLETIKDIFSGTRDFVDKNFGLDLRIGIVSLREIRKAGKQIYLGKYSSTNPFSQSILSGDGIDYAEEVIKIKGSSYLLPTDHKAKILPNYSGFSCPFQDVKSSKGTIIALIIKSKNGLIHYDQLIGELLEILGHEDEYYPVSWENLEIVATPEEIRTWAIVSAGTNQGFFYQLRSFAISLLALFMKLIIKVVRSQARVILPKHTDHKKFDGSIKMVVSCLADRRSTLQNWLDTHETSGDFIYGLHESDSTRITCVFQGSGGEKEHHLIDGSNGGYAMAAKQIKEKLKNLHN